MLKVQAPSSNIVAMTNKDELVIFCDPPVLAKVIVSSCFSVFLIALAIMAGASILESRVFKAESAEGVVAGLKTELCELVDWLTELVKI